MLTKADARYDRRKVMGLQTMLKKKIPRALEIAIALFFLGIFSPIMVIIAIIIKIDSPGPAIFKQTRIGIDCRSNSNSTTGDYENSHPDRRKADLGGKPFTFYKFRTMVVDARERFPELYRYEYSQEEINTMHFKIIDDPRLTPFGSRLRKTTLDELPNFINVLTGDMSLVGPRPDIPEMVRYYQEWQKRKFQTKPGITGLAQANGRALLSFQETLNHDVKYVESKNLALDAKILFKTIKSTLFRIGAF